MAVSDISLKNLENGFATRFQPGQRVVGAGRRKGVSAMARQLTKDGETLARWYARVWRGKMDGFGPKERMEAAQWLSDRGFGKAVDVHLDLSPDAEQSELAKTIARELAGANAKTIDLSPEKPNA